MEGPTETILKKGVGMGKGPIKKGSSYSTETKVVQNIWKTRSGGDNLIGCIMREKVVNMRRFHMQESL
jgi:hypothetical protein